MSGSHPSQVISPVPLVFLPPTPSSCRHAISIFSPLPIPHPPPDPVMAHPLPTPRRPLLLPPARAHPLPSRLRRRRGGGGDGCGTAGAGWGCIIPGERRCRRWKLAGSRGEAVDATFSCGTAVGSVRRRKLPRPRGADPGGGFERIQRHGPLPRRSHPNWLRRRCAGGPTEVPIPASSRAAAQFFKYS